MENASLMRPLAIFAGIMVLAQIVFTGLAFAFPDLKVPSFVNIVILILAAMASGRSFGTQAGRVPNGGEKARFAVIATLVSVAINLGFLAGVLVYYGFPVTAENMGVLLAGGVIDRPDMAGLLYIVVGLGLAIGVAVCFAGFGSGAKQALKARGLA